ncbi:Zinc finger protein 112 [Portunus trituberculatus]|uniref:Zinc finger protein 112 n=2 Tax=Portunus trituberculatus TaxID=210409 RepID=A0A5B7ES70_PORTR|nr:Zinc finger protein 112 [Portunus trituberculatus]
MKLHLGERPFECEYCGAGFAQRSNLKTHVQRMHTKLPGHGRRRIKCDECPAMFRLRRCLKTHKKKRHPIKSLKIKILRESKLYMKPDGAEGKRGGLGHDDEGENDIEEGEDGTVGPSLEPIVQLCEPKEEPYSPSYHSAESPYSTSEWSREEEEEAREVQRGRRESKDLPQESSEAGLSK